LLESTFVVVIIVCQSGISMRGHSGTIHKQIVMLFLKHATLVKIAYTTNTLENKTALLE